MTAHIIGKNPSILTYPKGVWNALPSFGLNHAAYLFGTRYAFAAHRKMVKLYQDHGYGNKMILTQPFYEGPHSVPCVDSIKQVMLPGAVAGRQFTLEEVRKWVTFAAAGANVPYPQWRTTLHLCMFYLMRSGYKEIHLHGCNLTAGVLPGMQKGHDWAYANTHTKLIIEAASLEGIKIIWHEQYTG